MPRVAPACRPALAVWTVWAIGVAALVAALVASGAIASGPAHGMPGVVRDGALWPLRSWDAAWYAAIARHGYPDGGGRAWAFFPLWPLALRLGPDALVAGALAVVGSAGAFTGVVAARAADEGDSAPARRTALALAALPGSFALLLAYPDACAVACASWATVLVRGGRRGQLAAAGLGAAAALLRPSGMLVALPLLWLARREGGRGRLVAGVAPLAAAAAWHAYAAWRTGGPAFLDAQRAWGRGGGPLGLARQLADVPSTGHVQTVVEAGVAALLILLCVRLWRVGPAQRGWAAYATAVLALSLGSGSFQSVGRQALLAFPLVWAAADLPWASRRAALLAGVLANAALVAALPLMAP